MSAQLIQENANSEGDSESIEVKEVSTRSKVIRITLLLCLIGFIIFVIIDSQRDQYLRRISQSFLEWVEQNPVAGIFSFVAVYFVATVLFIPGSILTLGSGFVFASAFGLGLGLLFSTISVFIGASTGSIAAFLFGRYLFRNWMENVSKRYKIFEAVDLALEREGLKIMVLLRLSPLIPFNVINYILGTTSVSLRDYSLACFAMLPGTILYTFLGSSAGSIVDSASSGSGNTTITIIVSVVGILFGILSIAATTYYAKKELNKIIDQQTDEEEEGQV